MENNNDGRDERSNETREQWYRRDATATQLTLGLGVIFNEGLTSVTLLALLGIYIGSVAAPPSSTAKKVGAFITILAGFICWTVKPELGSAIVLATGGAMILATLEKYLMALYMDNAPKD